MMKTRIKLGDIFSVLIDHSDQKFFQYVANDSEMLNSSVIRAFKEKYAMGSAPKMEEIVRGEVAFYAHVFLRNGVKLGAWKKVGNLPGIGTANVLFRDSEDYGNPAIKKSENWHVWRIDEPQLKVGKLSGESRNAEIGVVVTADDVIERMRTGKYSFFYPGFE